MYTYFEPDGPLLVFPMRGNRVRLIAQIDAPAGEATQDALQRLVDQRAGRVLEITGSHWLTTFDIHHAQVPAYRHGRVFLAGDAAHVHSPAGGQGMNTGIQDALDLARRLGAVLRGGAPDDSVLDGYETDRRPIVEEVVAFTDKMTRVATLGSPALRGLRNTALRTLDWIPAVHHRMALNLSELNAGR
jgi:2-polyprenyl-6-methoxyphenol hydroxylase-like FAD-dependent oxidoreductase